MTMIAPLRDYEDFKRRVLALPKEQQEKILNKLYDMAYADADAGIFRVMATAIKQAKESGEEGHERLDVTSDVLKKLSHIQDTFRQKDKK